MAVYENARLKILLLYGRPAQLCGHTMGLFERLGEVIVSDEQVFDQILKHPADGTHALEEAMGAYSLDVPATALGEAG